jgi:ABC-type Fe3+-hydroxamate transport system substrate-binding protein
MIKSTDGLGREVVLPRYPRRIISLVPSQTELLYDLGLDEAVAGITKFCIHPEKWFREKPRVGGTKDVHPDRVLALQPDLVIANEEENVQEQVEAIAEHCPVWVSVVHNLDTALQMIRSIGALTGREEKAGAIAASINTSFEALRGTVEAYSPLSVAYLIWKDPYMTAGGDTFIHDMLVHAGFVNVFGDRKRYPAVTIEDLRIAAPDVLLLSSEPYPFREKHIPELQAQLPATRITCVDGEAFSWYGSRLLHTPAYFTSLRTHH